MKPHFNYFRRWISWAHRILGSLLLRFAGQGEQSLGRGMSFPLNFREIPGQLCFVRPGPRRKVRPPHRARHSRNAQLNDMPSEFTVLADFHGQTNKSELPPPRVVSSLPQPSFVSVCADGKLSNKLYMFVHLMLFWFCVLLVLHPSLEPFRFTNWPKNKKKDKKTSSDKMRSGCNELVACKTKKWR